MPPPSHSLSVCLYVCVLTGIRASTVPSSKVWMLYVPRSTGSSVTVKKSTLGLSRMDTLVVVVVRSCKFVDLGLCWR